MHFIFTLVLLITIAQTQDQIKINILVVTENVGNEFNSWVKNSIATAEAEVKQKFRLEFQIVAIERANETASWHQLCGEMYKGISLILDLTWTGWYRCRTIAEEVGLPYLRADASIQPFVRVLDDYLMKRTASDAALIFQNEAELDQGLYYLIATSILRVIVLDKLEKESVSGLRDMRPSPSYYAIFASTTEMRKLFDTAVKQKVATRFDRWNLVFMDFKYDLFQYPSIVNVSLLHLDPALCCKLRSVPSPCTCPSDFQIQPSFLKLVMKSLTDTLMKISEENDINMQSLNCTAPESDLGRNTTRQAFMSAIENKADVSDILYFDSEKSALNLKFVMDINVCQEDNTIEKIANWTESTRFNLFADKKIQDTKRFFRIGTTEAIPWSYKKRDPKTGKVMKNADGTDIWEGYCVDLIQKLSQDMTFDYELVIPQDGSFGIKNANGTWNGLVGDLAKGETDIVVAALTMTSEREEVIDFVAPYFEQSGILIVIRKPVRETSLFKFMTVLKVEVWLSIVGALVATGIMIWLLDKYSPYSARNNKQAYPYPCRDFTLKESFWFALTSFTPQGGGEAPKALSARTLVAAYWLFVVLMLATFTANLAAFLTVERMQTPVQSLEQLSRQSRINYTVVANSDTHQYFINMKGAEDTLYKVWKEITLNSTSDQTQYRVWDYPVKEQYGHILLAINNSMPVKDAVEGFRKVNEHTDADFAFIHDSAEIKYEVTRNCNLTEVGEVFAEQPYAIAVQQGSHLQDEISRSILDLQINRYFEQLSSKYWNHSAKGTCPNTDDSEGITLESLGGVFIATLFGLALAMITLAGEIFYHKRKKRNTVQIVKSIEPPMPRKPQRVTIGSSFRPVIEKNPRISYISVFPRNQLHP